MSTLKTSKTKRLLSLVMTLVMLLGLLPLSAVSAGAEEVEQTNVASMLAATNGLNEDLPTWNTTPSWELIKSVFFQDTRLNLLRDWLGSNTSSTQERYIRLEADIDVSEDYLTDKIVVNGKKVLDLNGHKLSIKLGKGAGYNSRQTAITVNSGATLMVIDSKGGGKIFGDSWICAPEDMTYERASTDLFYNKGTLIINVPDGEIETGRSKQQWVSGAAREGSLDALGNYHGYIRGQSNGTAVIGTKNSTTVLVSGKVIGRGFYKFGSKGWSLADSDHYPEKCSAVNTKGRFIMYGGELHGLGGADVLNCNKDNTLIYSGYFHAKSLDKMAIQKHEPGIGRYFANYTKRCEYGYSAVGSGLCAPDAEIIIGKNETTVRPKSVTDMTSNSVVLSHRYGTNIIDPKTQSMWVVYAYYTPYYSETARKYIGNGQYTGDPHGYDYKLSTNWKAKAEFTVLDSKGGVIGYSKVSNWLKDEADRSVFRCDVLECKGKDGSAISWKSEQTYTLRCKITESWGGDPEQTRTVYQDLVFSIWDQDTLQAAKSMDFEFTPTTTAKGDPTNFLISLKDSCFDAAKANFITKMDIRYSYYVPKTNYKGEITRYEKKTETAATYADIIKKSAQFGDNTWFIGKDTVLKPKAAGPLEVAIDMYTSNGRLVDTKFYKIFAMPALTGRFLSSEKYTVPADGYTMEAQFTAWKAYMNSGIEDFAAMTEYSVSSGSVIWQYRNLDTNEFVDIASGDSRFTFEDNNNILATNRTGEYRASYQFQGARYYSPRTIFVIATNYSSNYKPYISGPTNAEYGKNEQIKVNLNTDADWSDVSEYTLFCRQSPQGANLRVNQKTNTTGVFTLEKDFCKITAEKFVPGDYVFEAKVRHANGVATSSRFVITYGVTSSGFTFSVDGKKADRLNTGDGKYMILSENDGTFKVDYSLYPANSVWEQYPTSAYDYTYVNLTEDIISLSDDGAATILAPGEAKIQLKIVKKSTGATVASPTLTVTIPVVGFEVEQPNYNDYLGQYWSNVKATVKSVWGPGGRKITANTDQYMTVSLKSKIGMGFSGSKVSYNDKGDITWTAQTKPGYQFAMEIVSAGSSAVYCRADVSTIQTNAFTDTIRTAQEHGIYGANSSHGYYTYYPGEDYGDPTTAVFEMTSQNAHVKKPDVQYIDVVSITTSTPAVGDPRYEGTDSNRYYDEYMTVELGSLSDLLGTDGKSIVRAETKVSKLTSITGSGKPYDNVLVDSSTEYTSVYNISSGASGIVFNQPTMKYEAGIYENWLRLDILNKDASGKEYCFAPDVKLFVNGHLIEFANVSYNSPPAISRLDVEYYFDVGDVTQYGSAIVDITDITPTVGMKPKGIDSVSVEETNDIEVTKLLWFVDENCNGKYDFGEEASAENGTLTADGTFISNKKYSVALEVGVADGAEGRLAYPFSLKVRYDDSTGTASQTKEQTVSSIYPNGVFTFPYYPISAGVTVYGAVTSFGSQTDDVTIQLIESGTSEPSYEAVVQGNTASYSINGVLPGTYTTRVMKKNHVTREYTMTVGSNDVAQNVKICLLGDINMDGDISIMDATEAQKSIAGLTYLNEYQNKLSDVNNDGNLSIIDATKIQKYIAGLISEF